MSIMDCVPQVRLCLKHHQQWFIGLPLGMSFSHCVRVSLMIAGGTTLNSGSSCPSPGQQYSLHTTACPFENTEVRLAHNDYWWLLAVSQYQEQGECTCVLVETGLAKLSWKNELGRLENTHKASCEKWNLLVTWPAQDLMENNWNITTFIQRFIVCITSTTVLQRYLAQFK